jgi:hypothetical protein
VDKVAMFNKETSKAAESLTPARSVAEMTFGSVKPRKRPEDFAELRQMFEEGVADEMEPDLAVSHQE